MSYKKWVMIGITAVALSAIAVVIPRSITQKESHFVTSTESIVSRVVDGDTLIADGQSVRLLGIDAPESGKCYAEEATEELKRLTLGKQVRLDSDPINNNTDDYGRLLRYIYLTDNTLVNKELISNGYAKHLSWFPITKNREFAELESKAKEKNIGLWNKCH